MTDDQEPYEWAEDWDEISDPGDDAPSGTDADFSGDTHTSLAVPADGNEADESDSRFDRLAQNARADMELSEFLQGDRKAVLVHKSHQYAKGLDRVVGYARKQAKNRCSVGIVVPFRQTPEQVRSFIRSFPNTAIRLADPEVHLHPDHYDEQTPTGVGNWRHFQVPVPATPDRDWALELLGWQAAVGATVLLSPTGKVEEANAQDSLDRAMVQVALARSIVGDAPMFVNLTLDHRWLSKESLRDRLLDEIVDSNERHWYLRFRWPIVDPAYGQLNDTDILGGYADLTAVCAEEGKVLVLPNSDLTGWVMTALGASGFGTATSNSDRRFAETRQMGSQPGRKPPPPKKRYFSRPVIHTIEQPTHHSLLGQANYTRCRCQFCVGTLRPDRAAPPDWDKAAVGYHYVQKAVMLTAGLQPDPRVKARAKVRSARRLVRNLPAVLQLQGDDRPSHLDAWRSLLT